MITSVSKVKVMDIVIFVSQLGLSVPEAFQYRLRMPSPAAAVLAKEVSYNRFVELQRAVIIHLAIFIKKVLLEEMHTATTLSTAHAEVGVQESKNPYSQNLQEHSRRGKYSIE